jgi:eukaryotic-like serine/threonine-protein kinase
MRPRICNRKRAWIFSSGTDHGQFYLVMELVEHGSLDDFIEQHTRLPEEQVLEAGIQTAKGLRAAYAKGLIHRDVKPANILLLTNTWPRSAISDWLE